MTEVKHTPGPWFVSNHEFDNNMDRIYIRDEYSEGRIATAYNPWDEEAKDYEVFAETEMKANARLIAAAPDLLEALEYYCSVMRESWGKDAFDSSNDHVSVKIRAAIAKAGGAQ